MTQTSSYKFVSLVVYSQVVPSHFSFSPHLIDTSPRVQLELHSPRFDMLYIPLVEALVLTTLLLVYLIALTLNAKQGTF